MARRSALPPSLVLLAVIGASSVAQAQSTLPPPAAAATTAPPAAATTAPPAEAPPTASPTAPAGTAAPSHTLESSGLEPALKPLGSTSTQPPAPAPLAVHVQEYPPSAPPPPPPFGTAGTFVVTGALTLSMSFLGPVEPPGATDFRVRVLPSLDYFVARNFSIGAGLIVAYQDYDTDTSFKSTSTTLGVQAGAGYNVPLGSLLSWWPQAHFGFASVHTSVEGIIPLSGTTTFIPVDSSTDEKLLVASADLPLLIHPAEHFFFGLGPTGSIDLTHAVSSRQQRNFYVALSSVVGGWF
jgi:hypothetical protein